MVIITISSSPLIPFAHKKISVISHAFKLGKIPFFKAAIKIHREKNQKLTQQQKFLTSRFEIPCATIIRSHLRDQRKQ